MYDQPTKVGNREMGVWITGSMDLDKEHRSFYRNRCVLLLSRPEYISRIKEHLDQLDPFENYLWEIHFAFCRG